MSTLILPRGFKQRSALDNLRDVIRRSCAKRGWPANEIAPFEQEILDQASSLDKLSSDDIIHVLRLKADRRENELIGSGKMTRKAHAASST